VLELLQFIRAVDVGFKIKFIVLFLCLPQVHKHYNSSVDVSRLGSSDSRRFVERVFNIKAGCRLDSSGT
jgi:hypothetical protein